MKFIKNRATKALVYGVSIFALAGVTNAYASGKAEAMSNDEILSAASRAVKVETMFKYKEDGFDDAQTWLVEKTNMQAAQQEQVTSIIQNYGDYFELDEIAQIQDIMEKQSVCKSISELKQYKTQLDKWQQYGADKKQKAIQEQKEAEERAAQEAKAAEQAAQQAAIVQSSQPVSYAANVTTTTSSSYSWNGGSARDFIVSKESGGNYNATNGRYFGAYQLDVSYLNGDLSQENQDRVAEQYVNNRYGSWENAAAHWQSHGWY